MKIKERLEKLKSSGVFKLEYEGKILGLRICIFNLDTCKYDYYDFRLRSIESQNLKDRINQVVSAGGSKVDKLISVNNMLVTESEIKSGAVITALEDNKVIESLIMKLEKVITYVKEAA